MIEDKRIRNEFDPYQFSFLFFSWRTKKQNIKIW